MRTALCFLGALGIVMAAGLRADDAKKDRDKFKGTWDVVSATRNGEKAPELLKHKVIFDGDSFTITDGDQVAYKGTYKLDPVVKPAAIDFKNAEGRAKGKTWLGIYEFDGVKLKICDNALNLEKARPDQFEAAAGSGRVCVVLKRATK